MAEGQVGQSVGDVMDGDVTLIRWRVACAS